MVRSLVVVFLVALVAGCPNRSKRHVGGEPPIPSSGDARARQRFEESRARFRQDGEVSPAEFEAIAREFPDDPIAPHALLYAGMASLAAGDYQKAEASLEQVVDDDAVEPAVRARSSLFLGIVLGYEGKDSEALAALKDGESAVDSASPDEHADYLAALAESSARTGQTGAAIASYDGWYAVGRPPEKAYAMARISTLASDLDQAGAEAVYPRLSARGPGRALVGAVLAGLYAASGDDDRAKQIRGEVAAARTALGLVREGSGGQGGGSGRVGAILPMSGRNNRVGDVSLRGMALAAGAGGDGGGALFPRPFSLDVRDDGSRPVGAATAVDQLAGEDVIAILGPVDSRSIEQAAARATSIGLPLISLSPAANLINAGGSSVVFHIVHSAEARARSLARYAIDAGVKDFAVLRPKSRFGEEVAAAFKAEVERGGGQIVVEASYPAGATAFTDEVKQLRKPWQALFVPDRAATLELIAPALAVANLVARPLGEKTKQGRPILLLSTADLVGPHFLRGAGRYAWGAVLAPGFYPDPGDPSVAEFAAAYQRSFGAAPTALDAYAFDAALVVRRAVESGVASRAQLADWLTSANVHGLSGQIRFGADHLRADRGVLYRVERIQAEQYELRQLQ
jgi:branched-chain amino acid transport system substrate-binding protein